ncbi:MAG: hypothetical protein ABIL58_23565 [Pseudomonadota bacterium]
MSDFDEKKIKAELEDIFGKIDRIVKRIDTEDPMKPEPDGEHNHPDTDPPPPLQPPPAVPAQQKPSQD